MEKEILATQVAIDALVVKTSDADYLEETNYKAVVDDVAELARLIGRFEILLQVTK